MKIKHLHGATWSVIVSDDGFNDEVIAYNLYESVNGYACLIDEYSKMPKKLTKDEFLNDYFSVSIGTDRYYKPETISRIKENIAFQIYKNIESFIKSEEK